MVILKISNWTEQWTATEFWITSTNFNVESAYKGIEIPMEIFISFCREPVHLLDWRFDDIVKAWNKTEYMYVLTSRDAWSLYTATSYFKKVWQKS